MKAKHSKNYCKLLFLVQIWLSYSTRYERGDLYITFMSSSDYTVQTLELKLKVQSLDNK